MKARTLLFMLLLGGILYTSCQKETEQATEALETAAVEPQTLILYTYDSFASDWGPAGTVLPAFTEATGIEVTLIAAGDAGQVLSRAILEKADPQADIILGIDNNMLARALDAEVLDTYKPTYADQIPAELVFDPKFHLTPYDYGYFSINADTSAMDVLPSNLEELTDARYENSLILMDPRTSSPGLGFLLWTVAVYGEDFTEYWQRLKPSILTIAEGWDSGYGLYTNGEAPMVLSYTTSPAYHVEYAEGDLPPYRSLTFTEGHYLQIEGAGVVKNAPHPEAAKAFIEFLFDQAFQSPLSTTNWMYPVNPDVQLPASFEYAPKTDTPLLLDSAEVAAHYEEWIEAWVETVSGH